MRLLGKLPPKSDERTLLFERYLLPQITPPARVDRSSRVHHWPMYGNDRLADCTCAAAAHMVQSWTAYARRRELVLPWREVVASYYAITGGADGSSYVGFALPEFALRPGARWEVCSGRPNEKNGHCVPAVGYDAERLYVVTWGRLKPVSWDFYKAYMDEAYVVLNRDWLSKGRTAPSGFNFRALERDLARF